MSVAPLVMLDFWGVIGVVQTEDDVRAMARRAGVPTTDFAAAYWRHRGSYDAGLASQEYWRRVAADLGVPVDAATVADLDDLDMRSWSRVDPEMIELVADLGNSGRRLALLSNAPANLVGHASAVVSGYISEVFFSSLLGLAKPDPQIYREVLSRLGVAAGDVVFVDDSPANVMAAEAVGMTGVHHVSVQRTRQALTE